MSQVANLLAGPYDIADMFQSGNQCLTYIEVNSNALANLSPACVTKKHRRLWHQSRLRPWHRSALIAVP